MMKSFKQFEKSTKIIMVSRTIGELLFVAIILAIRALPASYRIVTACFVLISLFLGWIVSFLGRDKDPVMEDVFFYIENIFTIIIFYGLVYLSWPYLGYVIIFALFPTIVAITLVAPLKKSLIISVLYTFGYVFNYFTLPNRPEALPYFIAIPIILSVSILTSILKKEIEKLAITDNLTNVYNQRYFQQKLGFFTSNPSKKFSLLLIDLDNFKKINDNYGHIEGDRILKEIANFMAKPLRKSDILARYGGEEFIVILPDTTRNDAKIVAEKIRRSISERNDLEKVTVSIGVSVFPEHGNQQKEILMAADKAMYKAKKAGKNRISVATKPV